MGNILSITEKKEWNLIIIVSFKLFYISWVWRNKSHYPSIWQSIIINLLQIPVDNVRFWKLSNLNQTFISKSNKYIQIWSKIIYALILPFYSINFNTQQELIESVIVIVSQR